MNEQQRRIVCKSFISPQPMSLASFVKQSETREGCKKKKSYKDLYFEKLNSQPTDIPYSQNRFAGNYSSIHQNSTKQVYNTEELSYSARARLKNELHHSDTGSNSLFIKQYSTYSNKPYRLRKPNKFQYFSFIKGNHSQGKRDVRKSTRNPTYVNVRLNLDPKAFDNKRKRDINNKKLTNCPFKNRLRLNLNDEENNDEEDISNKNEYEDNALFVMDNKCNDNDNSTKSLTNNSYIRPLYASFLCDQTVKNDPFMKAFIENQNEVMSDMIENNKLNMSLGNYGDEEELYSNKDYFHTSNCNYNDISGEGSLFDRSGNRKMNSMIERIPCKRFNSSNKASFANKTSVNDSSNQLIKVSAKGNVTKDDFDKYKTSMTNRKDSSHQKKQSFKKQKSHRSNNTNKVESSNNNHLTLAHTRNCIGKEVDKQSNSVKQKIQSRNSINASELKSDDCYNSSTDLICIGSDQIIINDNNNSGNTWTEETRNNKAKIDNIKLKSQNVLSTVSNSDKSTEAAFQQLKNKPGGKSIHNDNKDTISNKNKRLGSNKIVANNEMNKPSVKPKDKIIIDKGLNDNQRKTIKESPKEKKKPTIDDKKKESKISIESLSSIEKQKPNKIQKKILDEKVSINKPQSNPNKTKKQSEIKGYNKNKKKGMSNKETKGVNSNLNNNTLKSDSFISKDLKKDPTSLTKDKAVENNNNDQNANKDEKDDDLNKKQKTSIDNVPTNTQSNQLNNESKRLSDEINFPQQLIGIEKSTEDKQSNNSKDNQNKINQMSQLDNKAKGESNESNLQKHSNSIHSNQTLTNNREIEPNAIINQLPKEGKFIQQNIINSSINENNQSKAINAKEPIITALTDQIQNIKQKGIDQMPNEKNEDNPFEQTKAVYNKNTKEKDIVTHKMISNSVNDSNNDCNSNLSNENKAIDLNDQNCKTAFIQNNTDKDNDFKSNCANRNQTIELIINSDNDINNIVSLKESHDDRYNTINNNLQTSIEPYITNEKTKPDFEIIEADTHLSNNTNVKDIEYEKSKIENYNTPLVECSPMLNPILILHKDNDDNEKNNNKGSVINEKYYFNETNISNAIFSSNEAKEYCLLQKNIELDDNDTTTLNEGNQCEKNYNDKVYSQSSSVKGTVIDENDNSQQKNNEIRQLISNNPEINTDKVGFSKDNITDNDFKNKQDGVIKELNVNKNVINESNDKRNINKLIDNNDNRGVKNHSNTLNSQMTKLLSNQLTNENVLYSSKEGDNASSVAKAIKIKSNMSNNINTMVNLTDMTQAKLIQNPEIANKGKDNDADLVKSKSKSRMQNTIDNKEDILGQKIPLDSNKDNNNAFIDKSDESSRHFISSKQLPMNYKDNENETHDNPMTNTNNEEMSRHLINETTLDNSKKLNDKSIDIINPNKNSMDITERNRLGNWSNSNEENNQLNIKVHTDMNNQKENEYETLQSFSNKTKPMIEGFQHRESFDSNEDQRGHNVTQHVEKKDSFDEHKERDSIEQGIEINQTKPNDKPILVHSIIDKANYANAVKEAISNIQSVDIATKQKESRFTQANGNKKKENADMNGVTAKDKRINTTDYKMIYNKTDCNQLNKLTDDNQLANNQSNELLHQHINKPEQLKTMQMEDLTFNKSNSSAQNLNSKLNQIENVNGENSDLTEENCKRIALDQGISLDNCEYKQSNNEETSKENKELLPNTAIYKVINDNYSNSVIDNELVSSNLMTNNQLKQAVIDNNKSNSNDTVDYNDNDTLQLDKKTRLNDYSDWDSKKIETTSNAHPNAKENILKGKCDDIKPRIAFKQYFNTQNIEGKAFFTGDPDDQFPVPQKSDNPNTENAKSLSALTLQVKTIDNSHLVETDLEKRIEQKENNNAQSDKDLNDDSKNNSNREESTCVQLKLSKETNKSINTNDNKSQIHQRDIKGKQYDSSSYKDNDDNNNDNQSQEEEEIEDDNDDSYSHDAEHNKPIYKHINEIAEVEEECDDSLKNSLRFSYSRPSSLTKSKAVNDSIGNQTANNNKSKDSPDKPSHTQPQNQTSIFQLKNLSNQMSGFSKKNKLHSGSQSNKPSLSSYSNNKSRSPIIMQSLNKKQQIKISSLIKEEQTKGNRNNFNVKTILLPKGNVTNKNDNADIISHSQHEYKGGLLAISSIRISIEKEDTKKSEYRFVIALTPTKENSIKVTGRNRSKPNNKQIKAFDNQVLKIENQLFSIIISSMEIKARYDKSSNAQFNQKTEVKRNSKGEALSQLYAINQIKQFNKKINSNKGIRITDDDKIADVAEDGYEDANANTNEINEDDESSKLDNKINILIEKMKSKSKSKDINLDSIKEEKDKEIKRLKEQKELIAQQKELNNATRSNSNHNYNTDTHPYTNKGNCKLNGNRKKDNTILGIDDYKNYINNTQRYNTQETAPNVKYFLKKNHHQDSKEKAKIKSTSSCKPHFLNTNTEMYLKEKPLCAIDDSISDMNPNSIIYTTNPNIATSPNYCSNALNDLNLFENSPLKISKNKLEYYRPIIKGKDKQSHCNSNSTQKSKTEEKFTYLNMVKEDIKQSSQKKTNALKQIKLPSFQTNHKKYLASINVVMPPNNLEDVLEVKDYYFIDQ